MRSSSPWTSLARGLALVAVAALPLPACGGEEDDLAAYEVTLTPRSDCEQVGQGGVNCVDEVELASVSRSGRWLFDYRGPDTFVLLTEDGRTLPGVYFANDGRVSTTSCTGGGGVCHFARVRSSGEDPQSGCPREQQHLVDLAVVDGVLTGELFDEAFTAEGCATPIIRQLRVTLEGVLLDEAVPARAEYAP